MHNRLVAFSAAAVLAGFLAAMPARAGQSPFAIGAPAPAFAIDRLGGSKLALDAYRGKPVFVNFFATWCPPCRLELPFITASYPRYRSRVAFVGIDEQESPNAVETFAAKMGMRYDLGIDQGDVAARYLVAAIPVSVFIDRTGVVRAVNRGYLTPDLLKQDLDLIARH